MEPIDPISATSTFMSGKFNAEASEQLLDQISRLGSSNGDLPPPKAAPPIPKIQSSPANLLSNNGAGGADLVSMGVSPNDYDLMGHLGDDGLRRSSRARKPVLKKPVKDVEEDDGDAVEYGDQAGHDARGRVIVGNLWVDLCDCLQKDCVGCHFPCDKCKSTKCGSVCRVRRPFTFQTIKFCGREYGRTFPSA